MSELWGFTSGVQQGQEFNAKQQLATLAIQEGNIDVQQRNVNLQGSKLALEAQQRMMKAMAAAATGPTGSGPAANAADMMANQLYGYSQVLLAGGNPEQAATVASKAGELQVHAYEIEKAQSEQQHKLWTDVANTLGNVKDDASWKSAQMAFAMEHPDEAKLPAVQQLFQKKFGEFNVQAMRDAALSQKDQAATKASNSRANVDQARTKVAETEEPLNRARTREANARADHLLKAGGKPPELPKAADTNYVISLVKQDFDLDSPLANSYESGKARTDATQVAEDAKDVMASNPGMSKKEALDTAYKAFKSQSGFSGLKPIDKSIGGTAMRPLPLPRDPSKLGSLEDNKWYMAPDKSGKAVPQFYSNGVFRTAQETFDDQDNDRRDDDEDEE